ADQREIIDALNGLSDSHKSLRNYSQALEAAQRAATLAQEIGNRELLLYALNNTASCHFSLNQLEDARHASEQAIKIVESLRTSERTLQQRLNAAAERQTRILSGKHTEDQTVRLQKEIDALTSEYQQVESQIHQASPRYAALTQPVPLTMREIQRNVLDTDTA